ncbi:LysR family transcriptional regulator [Sphingorhabdus sp.]|jgi:DNA-binding transcriptional LysR family regulator|uniref:LysR family transcriptional regulator n=1 Tax=Sphingorhabdus sp. TaxID=1902408 RepID=UPI003BB0DC63|nr:LysR family transcriptional regulator [Sphingomonadales bacterium]MBK9431359.1 LysR family transcriptional regulator [Sphingomonadales bacterium]MBL0022739.1 LysR family transcriptional regulator [Sphingomonadales bacterium]
MRLRQIEVFHAVYANGSISAAARGLNVSQPAVSKVLRHTETQLGIRLFDLVRGRLVPTDEAHALFREVDEVFGRIASLQITANNLRNAGAGHLRIGVAPSLGLEIAPAAISAFRKKFPSVTFDIKTLHHNDVLRALYERECDLAIGYDPPDHPRLKSRKLSAAQLYLIARPGHFPSVSETLDIAELSGLEIVSVNGSGPIGDLVETALEKAQVEVREIISVGTYYIAAALVRFGSGVAIVDEFTARSMVSHGLDTIEISPEMRFGVHAIWLEDRPPSKLGLRFVKAIEEALQK